MIDIEAFVSCSARAIILELNPNKRNVPCISDLAHALCFTNIPCRDSFDAEKLGEATYHWLCQRRAIEWDKRDDSR